jgi:hypothetical protein
MKTNHKLALAVLAGVSIGVAGAKAMHAREATPPPVYVISEVDEMDLTGLQKYGRRSRRRWRLLMATITFSSGAVPRHRLSTENRQRAS